MKDVIRGFLLAMMVIASPSFAAEKKLDDLIPRVSTLIEREQNYMVGKLVHMDGSYCTGTLVSSRVVITAGHCVYDFKTDAPRAYNTMVFVVGLNEKVVLDIKLVEKTAYYNIFSEVKNNKSPLSNLEKDIGVIILDSKVEGMESQKISYISPDFTKPFSITSYYKYSPYVQTIQNDCRTISFNPPSIYTLDCKTDKGASGSPVFQEIDGERYMVGVISSTKRTKDIVMIAISEHISPLLLGLLDE